MADLTAHLRTLATPCLLIWGDADPISPVAVGQHLQTLLPRSQLKVLPGDHDVAHGQAPAVAHAIGQFVQTDWPARA